MTQDEKIEKAIQPLINMYEDIENELLIKIASHFKINDEFLNSDYWRIQKLEEMGLFNDEVVRFVAKYSNKTREEVYKALNDLGVDIINIPKLKGLFDDEKLKINPSILENNYVIREIINNAYNELNNTFIQMSSKIEKSARDAYLSVVEEAYLKTSMGTHSYQEAIRESINDLSNKGLTTLTYTTLDETGEVIGVRNYDIEAAVRRELLTNTRRLASDINEEVAEELQAEYLYLSEHLECRPTHFDWQGTVIKKEDLTKPMPKYPEYGDVAGICGINCRHYFEAYFGNPNDIKKQYTKEQCTEAYNKSQQQRYLERGVRKWKRKAEMFKENGDLESFTKSKEKIKEWQLRTKEFTEENNLKRDFTREYVNEKYPNWYVKLTKEERYAINSYFSSDSYLINNALRNNQSLDERLLNIKNNLSGALSKIPNSKGTYNRSLFFYDEFSKEMFQNTMQNGKVNFTQFISTSKNVYDENDDIRLIMHCKTAKDLSKLNVEEAEVLLDINKDFKVLKTWRENDKIFYELEEIE